MTMATTENDNDNSSSNNNGGGNNIESPLINGGHDDRTGSTATQQQQQQEEEEVHNSTATSASATDSNHNHHVPIKLKLSSKLSSSSTSTIGGGGGGGVVENNNSGSTIDDTTVTMATKKRKLNTHGHTAATTAIATAATTTVGRLLSTSTKSVFDDDDDDDDDEEKNRRPREMLTLDALMKDDDDNNDDKNGNDRKDNSGSSDRAAQSDESQMSSKSSSDHVGQSQTTSTPTTTEEQQQQQDVEMGNADENNDDGGGVQKLVKNDDDESLLQSEQNSEQQIQIQRSDDPNSAAHTSPTSATTTMEVDKTSQKEVVSCNNDDDKNDSNDDYKGNDETTTVTKATSHQPAHNDEGQQDEPSSLSLDDDKVTSPQQKNQQQQRQHNQPQKQQPEGWRVKLYRLNGDGSWDDCGTGRILCLQKETTATPASSFASPPSGGSISDVYAYHQLGEPTLCMHSEVPNDGNNNNNGGNSNEDDNKNNNDTASVQNNNNDNDNDNSTGSQILLRTRILLRDAYQRQGDNIITWCEPYSEEGTDNGQGVDLALSFQDNAGCSDIWKRIQQVQARANELFRRSGNRGGLTTNHVVGGGAGGHEGSGDSGSGSTNDDNNNLGPGLSNRGSGSVTDVAHAVAAAHHASLQRQDQRDMWVNVASEAQQNQNHHHHQEGHNHNNEHHGDQYDEHADGNQDQFDDATSAFHDGTGSVSGSSVMGPHPQLPNPPTLSNLEEIADIIAAVQHVQQKENLALYIAQNDCSYLKSLLSLFPKAEDLGDYGSLATLAACVKTILLLNEPGILELIVMDEVIFEEVCATLEYDPDLSDKANHRWYLRERLKFRTVARMEDEELILAIHRSFRICYLRDTILRPTVEEHSLSTLNSLQTFTHAEVVKGVTSSPIDSDDERELLRDSYLAKVIRVLGREVEEVCDIEWKQMEDNPTEETVQALIAARSDEPVDHSSIVLAPGKYQKFSTIWKQHLAPQDGSMESRIIRRRGSISFLRELFNMVRISLQDNDKNDFFAVLVSMEVDLLYDQDSTANTENEEHRNDQARLGWNQVNLISLLATLLSYPDLDNTEKQSVLEIISGIALHDSSLIRKRCLDFFATWKNNQKTFGQKYTEPLGPARPNPNEKNQVIFQAPSNDLLSALLYLLGTETDVGILLQVSEIMRQILDTDVIGDHGLMATGFADEAEGIPPSGGHNPPHDQHFNPAGTGNQPSTVEQNSFLLMFYEHYIQWMTAPFQHEILYPLLRQPHAVLLGDVQSQLADNMKHRFLKGLVDEEPLLRAVPGCAMRSSFAIELLSFCVRAHLYRMKFYLLRSRVLWNVLKLLKPSSSSRDITGDRCLKLASLRFLRAILQVNDESYHRHIIQNDHFGPVFEAFRANPVGDNLVSSSILEMCDYITQGNINSLIEHIATNHLLANNEQERSLEDMASTYVETLTELRKAYEKILENRKNGVNIGSKSPVYEPRDEKQKAEQSKYEIHRQEEEYFNL